MNPTHYTIEPANTGPSYEVRIVAHWSTHSYTALTFNGGFRDQKGAEAFIASKPAQDILKIVRDNNIQ